MRSCDGIRRTQGAARASLDDGIHGSADQIEDGDLVSGLDEVERHWRAHVAKSDEGDLFHADSPSCLRGLSCGAKGAVKNFSTHAGVAS